MTQDLLSLDETHDIFNEVLAFLEEEYEVRHSKSQKYRHINWLNLSQRLSKLKLSSLQINLILASLENNIQNTFINATNKPLRILHHVEQDILSADAYGLLLKCIRLGVLDIIMVENLVEEIASLGSLPIKEERIARGVAKRWRFHIKKQKIH
jgi:hypothetical protein